MQRKFWIISLLSLSLSAISPQEAAAQELNATVQVLSSNIGRTNKQVFTTLQTSIREFLNNTKWTQEVYEPEEKISCTFILNITENSTIDQFSGTIQIQYSRPVYKSGYASQVFLYLDRQLSFQYLEYDRLDFSENTSLSNLTSILAFYVYVIIGLDHDTFAAKSGDEFYQKAQLVMSNAQGGSYPGWASFDGNKSRYWLIDNLLNSAFDNYRNCLYQYHRQGLDLMHEPSKQMEAKQNIKKALMSLEVVNQKRPNSFLLQLFFDAKNQEIVDVFSGGDQLNLADLKELLMRLDATNANRYNKMGPNR